MFIPVDPTPIHVNSSTDAVTTSQPTSESLQQCMYNVFSKSLVQCTLYIVPIYHYKYELINLLQLSLKYYATFSMLQ